MVDLAARGRAHRPIIHCISGPLEPGCSLLADILRQNPRFRVDRGGPVAELLRTLPDAVNGTGLVPGPFPRARGSGVLLLHQPVSPHQLYQRIGSVLAQHIT